MSDTILPCSKCGCEKLYVIDPVRIPNFEFTNAAEVLPVHTHDRWRAGHFLARVCRNCGFTEWYARDLSLLARFGESEGVRAVTASATEGKNR